MKLLIGFTLEDSKNTKQKFKLPREKIEKSPQYLEKNNNSHDCW